MHNIKPAIIITSILALTLLCGCKDKQKEITNESGWIVGQDSKTIADMSPEDVIVSIEGVDLTCAEYKKMLGKIETRFRASGNTDNTKVNVYMKGRARNLVTEFLNRQLLICEAKSRGLKVPPEMLKSIEDGYKKQADRIGTTLDQMISKMGDTRADFDKRVQERALIKTLIQEQFGDSLRVTAEDIKTEKESYVKYNEMCDATNKLVIARGKQLMEELKGGADFGLTALACSEDEGVDPTVWGEFTRLELDEAEISSAAFTKPVGSIQGPFDTDEGLVIIKILERKGVDPGAAETEPTVKLARILLKMGQNFVCPADDQLKRDIMERKRKNAMQPFLVTLNKKFRVEFPHGIELWEASKQAPLKMDR